ncbi:MAG TPA: hypothetical protein VK666_08885 [Chryseolinea sp.]|nr:hypothetical protein [Chryseolinea sp.]
MNATRCSVHLRLITLMAVWMCSTVAWSQHPAGRSQHAAAFDYAHKMMLVFGGSRHYKNPQLDSTLDASLWGWDGSWHLLSSNGPSLRDDAKLACDKNGTCYLIGGRIDGKAVNEFWIWNGTSWMRIAQTGGPGKRLHSNITYDYDRHRIVLFGGIEIDSLNKSHFKNDIWEWNGSEWQEIRFSGGPSPRFATSMVYSPAFRRTLIIGGINEKEQYFQEVWSWDGNKFELLSNKLPKLETGQGNAVCMDKGSNPRILYFGRERDEDDSIVQPDTWLWNGLHWDKLEPKKTPGKRELHMMVYDPGKDQVILFGGNGRKESNFQNPDDVWVFNSQWILQK